MRDIGDGLVVTLTLLLRYSYITLMLLLLSFSRIQYTCIYTSENTFFLVSFVCFYLFQQENSQV